MSIKGGTESSARTGKAINFLQLKRFGEYSVSTYRSQFQEKFDFFEFNKNLVKEITKEVIIRFDPSYLSKSGSKTHGIGYYWSGVAWQTCCVAFVIGLKEPSKFSLLFKFIVLTIKRQNSDQNNLNRK